MQASIELPIQVIKAILFGPSSFLSKERQPGPTTVGERWGLKGINASLIALGSIIVSSMAFLTMCIVELNIIDPVFIRIRQSFRGQGKTDWNQVAIRLRIIQAQDHINGVGTTEIAVLLLQRDCISRYLTWYQRDGADPGRWQSAR